ncbi:MAG TPA: DUF2703 domain-containing protein [Methanosarcina sp.]
MTKRKNLNVYEISDEQREKERFGMKDNLVQKNLTIEWRHLDIGGETCERCSGTYGNILEAITSLEQSGELEGIQVEIIDNALKEDRIKESNLVLINDIPIERLLGAGVQYTECSSCGDLTGNTTCCRAVTLEGTTEETLPMEMIRAAIRAAINQTEMQGRKVLRTIYEPNK